jgi:hypothetical protein
VAPKSGHRSARRIVWLRVVRPWRQKAVIAARGKTYRWRREPLAAAGPRAAKAQPAIMSLIESPWAAADLAWIVGDMHDGAAGPAAFQPGLLGEAAIDFE